MKQDWIRWWTIGAVFVVCTAAASAQQETLPLDRDRDPALDGAKRVYSDVSHASLHYGSIYLLSRFELSDLAIEPDFTPEKSNNLALSIVAGLPNRIYWFPSKKFALSADATPSLAFVDRSGLTTQSGYALRGDAHLLLNHLYLDVHGATADELGPLPSEVGGIGTATSRTFGADAELKYSSKTSVLLTAAETDTRYPDGRLQPDLVPIELYDNDERRFRGTILHKTLPRVSLSATAERSDWDFPNSLYADARRDHVALGAGYVVGRRSIRAEAGPARLSSTQDGFHDYQGIIGRVRASAPVGRRWTVGSAVERDVKVSNFQNTSYYVTETGSLAADWVVTQRLSFQFAPTAGRLSYDVPVNGVARKDNYKQLLAGWTYSTTRFRGGFDVVYYERQSNVLIGESSGIRLIVRLSLTGSSWYK